MKFNFIFKLNVLLHGAALMPTRLALAILLCSLPALFAASTAAAQEMPYLVTYDNSMEDPGDLEISFYNTLGVPGNAQPLFIAPYLEFEYGAKPWWTTSLYLEGQSTEADSTIFTGWRVENRFQPLRGEHRVNPLLYLEYENVNEASRIQKEIVGPADPAAESNAELRRGISRELEGKLILSSTARGWNFSENVIFEKNLTADEGVEFGYALGVARPLRRTAASQRCRLCRERIVAGLELYGGLGSTQGFGLAGTAHYLAPAVSWRVAESTTCRFSPSVGLTRFTSPVLLRFGCSYEVEGFGDSVARLFRHGRNAGAKSE